MSEFTETIQGLHKDLAKLQNENADLKELASRLSDAANQSQDKETSWIYAMEGNLDGVWDWNAVSNEVYFSSRWKGMLGFSDDEITNDLAEWDKRLHPDDRDDVYQDLNDHLEGRTPFYHNEHRLLCKDGSYLWILDRGKIFSWTDKGEPLRIVGTHTDIHVRKSAELENLRLVSALSQALAKVKVLSGFLPICASCKNIRDDKGYWNQIESYISEHTDAEFSHAICPSCAQKLYPELDLNKKIPNSS
ncbi:hypothetical protein A9Q77_02385 [Marinomonas sp. 42_23_T18]|nr:hypothetical protein A9Q77_02385 [Marinomonas sp. 42_23_T18]